MTKPDRETIYLYAGEDHPKVKLTRVREFKNVPELTNYFHTIQDTFYVEFETTETITENLKLRCISYGVDELDGSVPFFILEYDEILDSFYVWKSEGKWEINKLIATLYMGHSVKGTQPSVSIIKSHPKFLKHPRRKLMDLVIDKLNIDWSKIDVDQFWVQLDSLVDLDKDDNDDEFSFKSFISIAVLKTKVKENKKILARVLEKYHKAMTVKYNQTKKDSYAYQCRRESSEESILPPLPSIMSTTTVQSSPMSSLSPAVYKDYNYQDSNHRGMKGENEDSAQVVTNFNRHFKLMAENYETFDLKSWAAFPRKNKGRKSRSSQQENCISKVKS